MNDAPSLMLLVLPQIDRGLFVVFRFGLVCRGRAILLPMTNQTNKKNYACGVDLCVHVIRMLARTATSPRRTTASANKTRRTE